MDLSVLIVDDDLDVGDVIARRIRKEAPRFSITVVESGAECLEHLKSNRVACILSDYQMPDMNGMKLLKTLRSRGNAIPFIFITAQGNEEVAREAFKNGAYDYFSTESGFAHFARITNSIEQAVRHHNAEKAKLRAEESLLLCRDLLNKSNDATFVNDPATGRFLIVNDKACGSLGYDRDKLLAMRTLDIEAMFPDQSAWDAHVNEVRNKGSMIGEGVNKRSDGSSFPVEVNVAYMTLGGKDYMVAVVRDITERRLAEQAIAEGERFLSSVFASIQDEITVLDLHHNIVRFNPAVERRYLSSMPLIGKKCYEAFLGRTEICEGCPSDRALRTGEAVSAEMPAKGPSGEVCAWVDIHSFPLMDTDTGKIKGVIEHIRDITDRKMPKER